MLIFYSALAIVFQCGALMLNQMNSHLDSLNELIAEKKGH